MNISLDLLKSEFRQFCLEYKYYIDQIDSWFTDAGFDKYEPRASTRLDQVNGYKLYAVHGEVLRKAKRTSKTLTEVELPVLWILTPTFSGRMIEEVVGIPPSFLPEEGMKEEWGKGVYFSPSLFKTGIVAIHQLPVNEETLALRELLCK